LSRELQRLNINMPADLIQQVDEYAERMNLNRTSAMITLVSNGLEQENVMSVIYQLLDRVLELEENARVELLNRVLELEERLLVR